MDKKIRNSVNVKARSSLLSALPNETKQNSYAIPTATTSVPGQILPNKIGASYCQIQMPQHQHSTRQRSLIAALHTEQLQSVNYSTNSRIPSFPPQQTQTLQKTQNNNNAAKTTNVKIAAAASCIASPKEQLAAVQAKATSSRNKNEEAISDLRTRIPEIENIFDIHNRIGNGTFSTVLLGTLKKEHNMPEIQKRKFAIKHHIPTSHPDRIMKELQCMAKIGGTDNVVGINCCIRYNESVAFIMPYLPHDRFQDFYSRMDVPEVQNYMKNLLIALRHVHRFNVIHRDVKPSNFLYNRKKRQFLLVDFGLAQQIPTSYQNLSAIGERMNEALTGLAAQSMGKRIRDKDDMQPKKSVAVAERGERGFTTTGTAEIVSGTVKRVKCTNGPPELQKDTVPNSRSSSAINGLKPSLAQTAAGNSTGGACQNQASSNTNIIEIAADTSARKTGGANAAPSLGASAMSNRLQQKLRAQGTVEVSSTRSSSVGGLVKSNVDNKYNTNRKITYTNDPKCFCYGNPQVCNICLVKKEIHASRAGTPGYRPPEVLLKYPDQTTAVDIWASGVIFLSVLSSVYPFFKAPNDYVALAEIVTIFGDKTIRKTALLLDRLVTLSQKTKPLDLRKLCVRFRNRSKFSSPELLKKYQSPDGTCDVCKNCDQFFFNCLCTDTGFVTEPINGDDIFPPSAYDLLNRLLEVNPHKRITADEALKHEFFLECQNSKNSTTSNTPTKNTTASISLSAAAGDSLKKTRN